MDTRIQNIIQGVTNAQVDEYAELIGRVAEIGRTEGEQMARHRYGVVRNAEEQARFLALREISNDRAFTDAEAEEWNRLSEMDEPPPVPRTGEQELRFLYLQSKAQDYTLNDDAEQREYNALRLLGPYEGPPLRKRINVLVSKTSGGDWRIRVRVNYQNIDLPPWKVIKGLLPVQHHQFLPTERVRNFNVKHNLSQALNNGLPAAILHEALKGWITSIEREQPNIETETGLDDETAGLLRAMPATLEVGGKVYKLIPAGEADVSPLIKRVRNKALAGAKAESLAIVQRASTDAQIVINQATQRRRQVYDEIERARANVNNPVPEWVRTSARAHKWVNAEILWHVELALSCVVTEIRLTARHWNCVLFWRPREFAAAGIRVYKVWLRLRPGGVYSLDDIYNKEYPTTHIAERCCMDLQGLPPAITSQDAARRLEAALSRGLSVVNLSSPLNHCIDENWPDFKEQIPEGVREYLRGNYRIDVPAQDRRDRFLSMEQWVAANPARVTWDRVVRTEEEANETFVVGDPRITHPVVANTAANVNMNIEELVNFPGAPTPRRPRNG